jgi:lipoyl(octanoyl) transferase
MKCSSPSPGVASGCDRANAVKVEDLGLMEYRRAWDIQREAFERVMAGGEEVLLLTEHPHVYTLGKSGREDNMLVGETFLKKIGADFVQIDRGGDITYHGPGQLVGYPILDLQRHGMGLREYIHALEQSLIDTLAAFGIEAGRSSGAAGVWLGVEENGKPTRGPLRKIAAIGVRSSRYVTMHGFALNVDPQMEYFAHINPCGFADRGVTSMARELGRQVEMADVKRAFVESFEALFGTY